MRNLLLPVVAIVLTACQALQGPPGPPGPQGPAGPPGPAATSAPSRSVQAMVFCGGAPPVSSEDYEKTLEARVYANDSRVHITFESSAALNAACGDGVYVIVPDVQGLIRPAPLPIGQATVWDSSHGWYVGPAISRWVRAPNGQWGVRVELTGGPQLGFTGQASVGGRYPNSNNKLIEIDIEIPR